MKKNELRNKYKVIRDNLYSNEKNDLIFNFVTNLNEFKICKDILIYYSFKNEVDTLKLIEYCLSNNKRVFLPRCGSMMDFYRIDSINDLKKGLFNIMEPIGFDNSYNNSICIVPGIVFDKHFNRVGYGKGYYDRFFCNYDGIKIGLCYDECLIDYIDADEYDKSVDIIVTDKVVLKKHI